VSVEQARGRPGSTFDRIRCQCYSVRGRASPPSLREWPKLMAISGAQVRAARALLGCSPRDLPQHLSSVLGPCIRLRNRKSGPLQQRRQEAQANRRRRYELRERDVKISRSPRRPTDEGSAAERPRQRPPEESRFRLQVDRQTKGSYPTRSTAKEAAIAIKRAYPIVHVTVFDAEEGQSEVIVLPAE
jgi:hypothetical protein